MKACEHLLKKSNHLRYVPQRELSGQCGNRNLFATLKSEMFYTRKFKTIEELKKEIKEYINYYNNDRIRLNLKGKSPVQYRTLSYQNIT